MKPLLVLSGLVCVSIAGVADAQRRRPAPTPSRYGYTVKFDTASLPKGVVIRTVTNDQNTRYFISNASDVPFVINRRFQNDRLVTANKLVSGKVLHYFPNGVPMAGKQHLKGWQAPFGEIKETLLVMDAPKQIYEGRKPGLGRTLPPPVKYSLSAELNGKPYDINGVAHFHLNQRYDEFYRSKEKAP